MVIDRNVMVYNTFWLLNVLVNHCLVSGAHEKSLCFFHGLLIVYKYIFTITVAANNDCCYLDYHENIFNGVCLSNSLETLYGMYCVKHLISRIILPIINYFTS